jgi:hypothetical protein
MVLKFGRASVWFASAGLASLALSACTTPFATRTTDLDWTANQRVGTITVSSPKMYRREALINERREEVAWLNDLLDKSKTVEFKPEIAREVEQITALAGALGLSFNPTAGLNYQRDQQTGDIQQEIDVIRLQLQLDQLKRDAELVRQKFEVQTDPVNSDLGKLGTGTGADATSAISASGADQLKAAIDKLNTNLTTRFDADSKLAKIADTTANPSDLFRDRAAYRDLLKSARNAASLDELHDLQGAALIRLTFQATVLPDVQKSRAPGVVQMQINGPSNLSRDDLNRLYAGWLENINQQLNRRSGEVWTPNLDLLRSAVADSFDITEYHFAPPPSAAAATTAPAKPPTKGKAKVAVVAAAPPAPDCPGLALNPRKGFDPACATLVLATPKFDGQSLGEGAFVGLDRYVEFFDLNDEEDTDRTRDQTARELLVRYASEIVPGCIPPQPGAQVRELTKDQTEALAYVRYEIQRARGRVAAGDVVATLNRIALRQLEERSIAPPDAKTVSVIEARTARARLFVATAERAIFTSCPDRRAEFRTSAPRFYLPDAFEQVLMGTDGEVSVYEMGPREQVQQISSVARSANSLALAVSIAAAQPGSGAAANAAANYSRQAMGKAQTQERVPAVVGYSQDNLGVFGWVLGPRATLDPKGRIDLEQVLKPYDLSVDLSLPGWWPYFDVRTATAWAPGARAIAGGTIGSFGPPIRVRMSPNTSDYDVLTARLAAGGSGERRQAEVQEVRGSVSACKASTIMVKGKNLWRTTAVLIGGRKVDGASIGVLPDMNGVLVDVPALDTTLLKDLGGRVSISVLTPYGDVEDSVAYEPKPASGNCKEEAPKPVVAEGPSVEGVEPLAIQVPAAIAFQVKGSKLNTVDRVTLNGQPGKLAPGKDGKTLEVNFTAEQTAGLPVSPLVKLSFSKAGASVAEKAIEVTANKGGN